MASEISITSKLSATKGGFSATNLVSSFTINMAATTGFAGGPATHIAGHTQDIGTTREAVDLDDVDNSNATGDEYILRLCNKDDTNFVTVEIQTGAATYQTVGIMRPGEPWGPVRLPKLDGSGYGGIFLDADTAICVVEVHAVEAGDPDA